MIEKRRHWWMYILIFVFSQIIASAFPFALRFIKGNQISIENTLVITLLIANLLAILLFFFYRPSNVTWSTVINGLQGNNRLRTGLTLLLAIPVIIIINILQEALFPEIPDLVGEETFKKVMFNPVGLLTITVLGPLSEELLFRGGVQTDLVKINISFSHLHFPLFIFISALIFSIVHLNPAQMPAAFIIGLVLGFSYWWTGSLVAPVCIHVFNNSSACLLSFISPDDDSLINLLGGYDSACLVIVICILFLGVIVWQMRRL